MELKEAVQQRRAVKHYDPDHQMSEQEKKALLEAALLSPTSFNIQNWRFVVVDDPAIRQQVREAAWNQAQITEASMLVIFTADLKSWQKDPARYWKDAPQAVADVLVPMIGQFYDGKEQLQRDEAMRSCGIAAQTLMLSAKDLGYDSCPMIGFDAQKVADIIRLPQDHVIGLIVVVGKAIKEAHPRGGQLDFEEVVIKNYFS